MAAASKPSGVAFEQDVAAVAHHPPGGAQDEDRDEDGEDRVDRGPAGPEDDERRGDGAGRAEEVAGDVQEGRAEVEVVAVAARRGPRRRGG